MPIDLSNLVKSSPTAPTTQPIEVVNSNPDVPAPMQPNMVLNLEKNTPGLKRIHVGCQWDAGDNVDLDLSSFSLHQNGKIAGVDDVLYYDQNTSGPGLQKSGDNRTGVGDGDDEWLKVTFDQVKPTVDRIVLVVTIYDAVTRQQTFGMVRNAMVHIDDADTGREIVRFQLTEDYSTDTAIVLGELVRSTEGWSFQTIGEGHNADLNHFVNKYQ